MKETTLQKIERLANENDTLRDLCEQMAGAIEKTRLLVGQGGLQGFNPNIGDWADTLFENNQDLTSALTAYEKHKEGEECL